MYLTLPRKERAAQPKLPLGHPQRKVELEHGQKKLYRHQGKKRKELPLFKER